MPSTLVNVNADGWFPLVRASAPGTLRGGTHMICVSSHLGVVLIFVVARSSSKRVGQTLRAVDMCRSCAKQRD